MKEAPASTPSNFLARMVERAGDRARSVLPRLPGLFEPAAVRPAGVYEPMEFGAEMERVGQRDRKSPSFRANPQEAPTQHTVDAGPHIAGGSRSHGDDNAARAQKTADAEQTEHARVASRREVRTARQLPEQELQVPVRESQANPPRSAVLLAAAATTAIEAHAASSASRDRDQSADAGASQTRPSMPAERLDEERPTRVLIPQSLVWTPSLAHSVPAHATGPSEDHAATAPVIHISIGRVEVRAAQPSAPAAKGRDKPHRPMSLDEYLKRQERAR